MGRVRIAAARPFVVTAAIAALAVAGVISAPALVSASPTDGVKITEFSYGGKATGSSTGGDGEYVEVTNLGSTAVDMTGWTYNRDTGGTAYTAESSKEGPVVATVLAFTKRLVISNSFSCRANCG